MPTPGEHKTVQARILEYAEAIGWTRVSREEGERRRGFDPEVPSADRAKGRSLFFDDLLDAKVREFNPRYAEAEGALLGQFRHLHTDIYGNPPSPKGYGGTGREFPVHSGLNRRERRDRKEAFDGSIGPQAAATFPGWEFWRRLCQNRPLASANFCNSLLPNSYIV